MATEKRLDLVEREAIKDAIGFMNLHFLGHGENKSVLDLINEVPSVDAVEVVHARNLRADSPSLFECSECGWSDYDTYTGDTTEYNYCPNCGAKMDGDGNG